MTARCLRFISLFILTPMLPASAAVFYVDANSTNPVPPYANWSTAAASIQNAVDAAGTGDLVLVTNGVYHSDGRLTGDGITNLVVVDKPMTVQSVNGQLATLIDGTQSMRCVYLTNGAVIAGFTLTNGTAGAGNGGGAYCASSTEQILNCLLIKNSAAYGGGVYSGTISNCIISANSADTGGGVAYSVLFNGTLIGNIATSAGGGGWSCTLYNCVIRSNIVNGINGIGGGVSGDNLFNCTVTGNTASGSGGGTVNCFSVNNSIVYFNSAPLGANVGANNSFSYSCATPRPEGTGNFAEDPQFVNYSGGDLHLATNSLCINTGENAYVVAATDFGGNPRVVGGVVDVGAYENQTVLPVPVAPSFSATYSQVITGYVVGFTGQVDGRPTASRWEFGDGTIVSNQLPSISHSWAAAGDYAVALRAYNNDFPTGVVATAIINVTADTTYYVNSSNSHPASPYSSWGTAATSIQPAIDAAYVGSTVLVSNGVYQTGGRVVYGAMSNRVAITKPVTLRSLNGPSVTIIQGYRAPGVTNVISNVRCVYLASGAALSGFTLTNGATRGPVSDVIREQNGGGVWCETTSGVVSDCVLVGNTATNNGGGIYQGTLYNCKLSGNSAYYGGGAYSSTLNNCVVMSNSAVGPGLASYPSYGGGVYSGRLGNCLLIANSATNGGGAYNCTLTNCTLTGNKAVNSGGGGYTSTFKNCIFYSNAAPSLPNSAFGTVAYSCAMPFAPGIGNFTNPPLFVDYAGGNLRLQSNSPCINAGSNLSINGNTDLDGRPRLVGGTVDVGAYEYQGPGMSEFIGWLQKYSLATDGTTDGLDADHDGMSNWQEWVCGTDPTNALSVLNMVGASNGTSGLTITWQSVSGKTYYLQRSVSLPKFSSIQSNIVGQAGTTSFSDATATGLGPYFYRVGVQ